MPEPNAVPAAPAAAQTTAEGGNANAQSGGATLQPEIQAAIQEGIKAAFGGKTPEEFRNTLFAAVRRGTPAAQTPEPVAKAKDGEPEMRERVRLLEEERQQVAADRREASILSALTAAGVPADRQDAALDHLERRFGSKIKYNRESRQVEFTEFEGDTPKPVTAFVSEFLKQPKGQIFLPPPATGSVPRGQGQRQIAGKRFSELTQKELDTMSPDERTRRMRESAGI